MPTYEYKCTECGHEFEVFQSMSDEPVKTCEKCGGKVRKLFGSAGIIFKGPGFTLTTIRTRALNRRVQEELLPVATAAGHVRERLTLFSELPGPVCRIMSEDNSRWSVFPWPGLFHPLIYTLPGNL